MATAATSIGDRKIAVTDPFNLAFGNIPVINLRMEFNATYAFIFSRKAEAALQPPLKAIRTELMIWGGMPEDLFTLLLQRSVLGIEAYLPGALMESAARIGNLDIALVAKLRNPFSLGSKSAVANIYHRMPSAVHKELSLKHLNDELYGKNVMFYQKVRNPIFHGQQLVSPKIETVRTAFAHLAELYEWIDCWYDPENLWPGCKAFAGVRSRYPIAIEPDERAP